MHNNHIAIIKGISGSGKSSRLHLLLKFLREVIEFNIEDFFIPDKNGKSRQIGYLVSDLKLVIIGKEYSNNGITRFQGLDSQTGVFGSNAAISDFLRDNCDKYSFIIEGAGTTQSHRFRPKFLYEYCGYVNIYMQYYNYGGEINRDKYYDRIIGRSGKKPTRDTMWEKEVSYTKEAEVFTKNEISELGEKIKAVYYHNLFNEDIWDFGYKYLLNYLDKEIADIFVDYCKNSNYIKENVFENFNKKSEAISNEIKPCNIITKEIKESTSEVKELPKDIKIGSFCELNNEKEIYELKNGFDFRLPLYRRKSFLDFYGFHLKYKSHPGAVYYLFPYIFNKYDFDDEMKLWWCFINGCTQNPCTTWVIFNYFPIFSDITEEDLEKWHRENWRKLDYDIDRRYQKGHFVEMWKDYSSKTGKSQVDYFNSICDTDNEYDNFTKLWKIVYNDFFMFGRLSTFSYLEYLRIAGVNINCNTLFLDDMEGSKSHRNGLSKVLGRDDLDWHKDNKLFVGYNKDVINWLGIEGKRLLDEAKELYKNTGFTKEINYFTLESTLCCYKSWYRENRRYPNVYNDMLFQRIKKTETLGWNDLSFDIFWEARKNCLPEYLRLEDNQDDPVFKSGKLHPIKQNHFRLTGQIIMMNNDYNYYENDFNKYLSDTIEISNNLKSNTVVKIVNKEKTSKVKSESINNTGSIFDKLSLDRNIVKWEDYLLELTPVQEFDGVFLKREDYFAPLGYGGINGSKLRQAIFLLNNSKGNKSTLVSGASINSPQLPMGAAVAKHFGLKSLCIIGATKPETAINKENIKMASFFGAEFEILKVGYNPVLQNRVNSLEKENSDYLKLHYGITCNEDSSEQFIYEFYLTGSNQVRNIPDEVERLIIPSGSCNSTVSILLGLALYRPKNLKQVIMIGIGPDKLNYINKRLNQISNIIPSVNLFNFYKMFDSKDLNQNPESNAFELDYINLHDIEFTTYDSKVKFIKYGIEFHPTYEAKVMKFVSEYLPELFSKGTMFWIIGSKPRLENIFSNIEETNKNYLKLKVVENGK